MNIKIAQKILNELAHQGMQTICLCPGARNAPFVECLSQENPFEVLSFYDERSAGFFALGRARRDRRPVGVFTTSGTAVAELLAPVIEAHYTETPLIVVSSDRPKRLRGTGAPQTIEQSQIFNGYVDKSWDIDATQDWKGRELSQRPCHINVCFDEPLIDDELTPLSVTVGGPHSSSLPFPLPSLDLRGLQGMILVGSLSENESSAVSRFLQAASLPVFAESTSGLRGRRELSELLIEGGEKQACKMINSGEIKSVLRIGDIPIGRFWRDLDQSSIPTISLSNKPWAGTEASKIVTMDLSQIEKVKVNMPAWSWQHWLEDGKQKNDAIYSLISDCPKSEVGLIRKLSKRVPTGESLYIGNSLPVRIWDLVDGESRSIKTNRGANGIDGQLSSAFGGMTPGHTHWVILGDLTALYDMGGFWLSPYLKENGISVNLIVINNKGGKIFSRIFSNPLFQNRHDLNFRSLAEMFHWNYYEINSDWDDSYPSGLNLIEVTPDAEQSDQFWEGYDRLWKN